MLLTITAAVFVLGVLIFVHELGHFLAAKSVGIGVPRFSLGLGPVSPLRWRRGETEYVLSWIPFGGYVKMATAEDEDESMVGALEGGTSQERFPPEKLFESKPLWARIMVIVAGVVMNALFAWLVFAFLSFRYGTAEQATTRLARVDSAGLPAEAMALTEIPVGTQILRVNGDTAGSWNDIVRSIIDPREDGIRVELEGRDPVVLSIPGTALEKRAAIVERMYPLEAPLLDVVAPGSPAERAGLKVGDEIVRFAGDTVRYWGELVSAIEARPGDTVPLTVLRNGALVEMAVVPDSVIKSGGEHKVGQIGVTPHRDVIHKRYGLGAAVVNGLEETGLAVAQVWGAIKGFVFGQISPRQLGGVLQIGQLSGESARLGMVALLNLMAFLSVNLAVLNLLPIPVLDGGHLVFLMIEGLKGSPVSVGLRLRLSQAGMVFLVALMLFALTNDVLRIIGR